MSDDKVVVLHPDLQDALEKLTPQILNDAIIQAIRLADAEGIPLCIVAVQDGDSRRWASQAAFDNRLAMTGALLDMIDGVKDDPIILLDMEYDDEDDSQL